MQNKGDSYRFCPNYERFWVRDTKHGHRIIILHKDGSRDDIDLRWPDRVRDENGRVIEKR
jgi:hypothetical protein|tara:strand:+ start:301 stop:480 length:180 start_codon:yes stop_codon:yes gene_type:complete